MKRPGMLRHERECAELKRRLGGLAAEFTMRIAAIASDKEAFEVWRHGFEMAMKYPENKDACAYSQEALLDLLGKPRKPKAL